MMGEEVFQIYFVISIYATDPMSSLYKARQAQQGHLFLLVRNRVFFHPAGVQQGFLSLLMEVYKVPTLKFCHGNQTKWSLVIKQINWIDNPQMIITAKYGSHHFTGYGENAI